MKPNKTFYIGFIALLGVPIVGAGVDIYVPSLPAIAAHFMVNKSLVQLSVSAYLIGYGVFQLIFGPLSDTVGRKPVLLGGALGFTVFGLLTTLSTNITLLLLLRFLQGVAGATIGSMTRALLPDIYKGKQYAKMSAYFVMCWGLGPILAPLIGGYLQHHFNWHAPLYFLSGYGFLISCCVFFMPESAPKKYPFNLITVKKNLTFVFSNPIFRAFTVICMMMYSLILIFNVIGPFLVQTVLHYSAFFYGKVALCMGIAWFLGNTLNRWLLEVSAKKRTLYGALIGFSIALAMTLIAATLPLKLLYFTIPTFFIIIIAGILFPTGFAWCLNSNPKMSGTVSAAMGASFATGSGLILALASLLKANNALPLSSAYIIILGVCLSIYFLIIRKKC